MDEKYLLKMDGITKKYPGVIALNKAFLHVGYGEVHGLMGENGAGKSTLIKILTGIQKRNEGTIIFDGENIDRLTPIEAQRKGISTIYQEMNMIPTMNAWENMFLGREIKTKGLTDIRAMKKKTIELLADMGIDIGSDLDEPLGKLSVAIQQMVSIARAISIDVKLLVMDEPTSSLTEKEVKVLFDVVARLKEKGISFIFISHRISEIFHLCDKVTILKDGNTVGQHNIEALTPLMLVSSMIGKDATEIMGDIQRSYRDINEDAILTVTEVHQGNKVNGIDLQLNRGEILGVSGLLGSGRTEFAKVVYGEHRPISGSMTYQGAKRFFKSSRQAVQCGMAFCSEDRKEEGIFPHMSVEDNLTIALLPRISKFGVVSKSKRREVAKKYIEQLRIKTPSPNQLIRNLSGGNQQKVLLARWLCMDPKLLILDEPTRGIDVGAKSEIEDLVKSVAKKDISVMMISSELNELISGCDRVVVLKEGKNVSELEKDEITEDNLMKAIAFSE